MHFSEEVLTQGVELTLRNPQGVIGRKALVYELMVSHSDEPGRMGRGCEEGGGMARQPRELLHRHGGTEITVFEKVYPHVLESVEALADWTSGTTLVPYFERLPVELHEPFMRAYRARLQALWPSGPVFYTFRRTIFAATRVGEPAF